MADTLHPRKHFKRTCRIKQSDFNVCSYGCSSRPHGCDAAEATELGAAWAPPPPRALTVSRLSAESGTSCTAMVSDSHAQTLLHSQSAWALGDCKASTNTCRKPATNPDSGCKRLKMKTGHLSHGVGGGQGDVGKMGWELGLGRQNRGGKQVI